MTTTEAAPAAHDEPNEAKVGDEPTEAGDGQQALPGLATADKRTIHQRMVAILAELPALGKDERNTQQDFMYRSHDAVLNALNPLLAKHGVYIVPEVVERERLDTRKTNNQKTMYEVNLLVRYSFIAEDGSSIAASAWGEGTDMGDKATNKAMTMAFKNVLAQAFAVSTQEAQSYDTDGGTVETTTRADAAANQQRQDPDRRDRLRGRIGELCGALDVQTQSEPGLWLGLVRDATQTAFGEPYDEASQGTLEEVGKALKQMQDGGISKAPEQLDLTTPF